MPINSKVLLYCDGACSGNQFSKNKGGWGFVVVKNKDIKKISGSAINTSNQKMELTACIEGLKFLKNEKSEIKIFSDSAYLINCMNEKWYLKWQNNGWKNSKKEKIVNQDLWGTILKLILSKNISFHKVEGHSGDKWNELANELAQTAQHK
ncbi:MAG: ribonuclease HI [Bacteroidetes bacterium]|nr:ribonuclease HI [Bacteroidota bacterium]